VSLISELSGGGGGDRTRVRQHFAYGSTCIVLSIDLAVNNPAPGKLCCACVYALEGKLMWVSSNIFSPRKCIFMVGVNGSYASLNITLRSKARFKKCFPPAWAA